jgi:23S rRNA pseudouridine1911/1915/1917 synthase
MNFGTMRKFESKSKNETAEDGVFHIPARAIVYRPAELESSIAEPCFEGPITFHVTSEWDGERLDRFLVSEVEAIGSALSRTRIKGLVESGAVEIDGGQVRDAGARLRVGQEISLDVPPLVDAVPAAEAIPLDIAFEDEHLIVVDKPAGLVVHPAPGHASGTLVNALISHCGDSLSGIGGVKRPGIVHRLDKNTSGLLVVAKSDAAHQGLAALFADHGRNLPLTRDYLAFVWGAPERPAGTIDAALGRHASDREKMAVVAEGRGRHAITHWRIVETFGGDGDRPIASLIACSLETGRTHQIRVHMAHIGHPVLGDPVYGRGFKTKCSLLAEKARDCLEALGRQALHAATLAFVHPLTGEEVRCESPLPADLQVLRDNLAANR